MVEHILSVRSLRKEFSDLVAVRDINFDLEPGQVVGLVGHNGAGKTTFLRMVATLLHPTNGTAFINGLDIKEDYLKIRKIIGFLPDFFNLDEDLTVEQLLYYYGRAWGIRKKQISEKIDEALNDVGLADKRSMMITDLSRGMVQRIGLATLIVRDPELYLLDEPASGLDPSARINLRDTLTRLSKKGKTIVISSHILSELDGFCSHIAFMKKGRLVKFGGVNEVVESLNQTKQIKIEFLENAQGALALLNSNEQVEVVSSDENTIVITTSVELREVAELNKKLVENGFLLTGFSQLKANLEDVFLQINR